MNKVPWLLSSLHNLNSFITVTPVEVVGLFLELFPERLLSEVFSKCLFVSALLV